MEYNAIKNMSIQSSSTQTYIRDTLGGKLDSKIEIEEDFIISPKREYMFSFMNCCFFVSE